MNVSPEALTKHIRTTLTSKRNVSIPPDCDEKGNLDYQHTQKATGIDNLSYEILACFFSKIIPS